MPKFSNDASRQAYAEKIQARKIYCAEQIWKILPGPLADPVPKATIFELAIKVAVRNGLEEHPYFGKAKIPQKRLRKYFEQNWGGTMGIRHELGETFGIFVECGHGLAGIRRAGKRGAEATLAWQRGCVEGSTESYNGTVGVARLLDVPAPKLQLSLLLEK